MNQFDDDRVLFYLKHEKLIREWAQIEGEVGVAVEGFLASLSDDIEALATTLGDDVRFVADDNSTNYSIRSIYRDCWAGASGEPRVTISLEWHRKKASLARSPLPFTALRVNTNLAGSRELSKRLSELSSPVRARKSDRYTSDGVTWPAYRYVPAATGEYWSDLSGHRETILAELRTTWDSFTAYADQAVAEVPEANGG